MNGKQILDELEEWLKEWERGLKTGCNQINLHEDFDKAANFYFKKQVIACLRHTQDKLKELREKTND